MAGGIPDQPGGILALCRLIERHGEAIEYDLLMAGRHIDELGESLSWRDLQVLLRRWQVTPGFAVCEAVQGSEQWSTEAQLLAHVFDQIASGNWIAQGNKNAPKPKRLPRPWEKPVTKQFGSEPIPLSEFDSWWESQKTARASAG